MKILKEYTLAFVKRNKKSSFAIKLAIMIATTILSSLFGFMDTMYIDNLHHILEATGNWHAELLNNTPGKMLKYVTGHPNVEAVMIKGSWTCAKINDQQRSYLILCDLTKNYWRDMPEFRSIIEGRIPASRNEIALSKQYFEHHPELKLGDTITLSIGNRTEGEEILEPRSMYQDGELFRAKEERTYTVVGILDLTTNYVIPGYLAYGYMEDSDIMAQDQLTVYIRFKNPRSTYKDIHQIAQSVGFQKDEYGKYWVGTNTRLLLKYFIFSPVDKSTMQLTELTFPFMTLFLGTIVMALFVYLIKNAFATSANERLRQLGILQSVGASPKQIRNSIVYEGFLLSIVSIPAGITLGWFLDYSLITYIKSLNCANSALRLSFGLPAILPSLCFALLTVWLSAILPARKLTRASTIDIIRRGSNETVEKFKNNKLIFKLFGIEGELARNTLMLRKKSYRIAIISLTLSLLLFSSFLILSAVVNTARSVIFTGRQYQSQRDIMIDLLDGNMIEPELQKQLSEVNGIKNILFFSDSPVSIWITQDMQSEEIKTLGGLSRIASLGKYDVYQENGNYRILSNLIALDDISFHNYCRQLGIDAEQFYDPKNRKTIVINSVKDEDHSNIRYETKIPYLKISPGDRLSCNEKLSKEDTGTYSFELQAGYITDQLPALGVRYPDFQLAQLLPASIYLDIISHFDEERAAKAKYTSAPIIINDKASLSAVTAELIDICDRWFDYGDFCVNNITDEVEEENNQKNLLQVIFICLASFFALIGFVNVSATITGNLRHRQRDFAMMKSIGLSAKGIRKMMFLEGIFLGFIPIIISLPIILLITGFFLKILFLHLYECLPFFPFLPIAAYALLIITAIILAYAKGMRKLKRISIIDAIRNDTV